MRSIGWLVGAAVIGLSAFGWAQGIGSYEVTAGAFGTNGNQIQGGEGFTAATAQASGAFASAELVTGQLKAAASSVFGLGVGVTQGVATLKETITLLPPPGYPASSIHVGLRVPTHATVSGGGDQFNFTHVHSDVLVLWDFGAAHALYCLNASKKYLR